MQIRSAVSEDARSIAGIHVDTWRAAYAGIVPMEHLAALDVDKIEARWRTSITHATSRLLVACDEERLTGWISFGPSRDDDATPATGEIWALYVAVSQWRCGVGRQLWVRAREELRGRAFTSVTLWVLASNLRARDFYRSVGFARQPASAKQTTLGGAQLEELRYGQLLVD